MPLRLEFQAGEPGRRRRANSSFVQMNSASQWIPAMTFHVIAGCRTSSLSRDALENGLCRPANHAESTRLPFLPTVMWTEARFDGGAMVNW